MHGIYGFVTGPLAWISMLIFVFGILYRLFSLYRSAKKKDPMVLHYMSAKYAFRSILNWSIPFNPVNSRRHPVMTVVTFLFHLCLIITPIFLTAHVMLWEYFHDIRFPSLPDHLADLMTVIVILACIFFGVRRAVRPEVRYVTSPWDWVLLVLIACPFVSGFLAYHQIGPYQNILIFHIITGEIWLAAIPFTRLSHMFVAPLTRAYIGSEFGAVRHARDW